MNLKNYKNWLQRFSRTKSIRKLFYRPGPLSQCPSLETSKPSGFMDGSMWILVLSSSHVKYGSFPYFVTSNCKTRRCIKKASYGGSLFIASFTSCVFAVTRVCLCMAKKKLRFLAGRQVALPCCAAPRPRVDTNDSRRYNHGCYGYCAQHN